MSRPNRRGECKNIWVHSDFARRIKSEAALRDMKILEFTEELASKNFDDLFKRQDRDVKELKENKVLGRRRFGFDF